MSVSKLDENYLWLHFLWLSLDRSSHIFECKITHLLECMPMEMKDVFYDVKIYEPML